MASEQTVRAFNDLKEIYMNSVAPEFIVEAKSSPLIGDRDELDVAPPFGKLTGKDFKNLGKLQKFRHKLGKGEHNSEESAKNVERNYNVIAGVRESYSNWREENPELCEAIDNTPEDKANEIKLKPGIKNKVNINPQTTDNLREAFADYGGELVSSEELDESYLLEAVEVATEYFYECGLNEYGVEELIESIGEQKFIDFVFDLVEDYELNEESLLEARTIGPNGQKAPRPAEPTTKNVNKKTGQKTPVSQLSGAAKKRSLDSNPEVQAKRAQRAAERENSSSKSNIGPELSRLSDRSKQLRNNTVQKNIEKAKEAPQNTVKSTTSKPAAKKGILNTVAGAIFKGADMLSKGAERHQAAMKAAQPVVNRAARAAGTVAGAAAGAATALRQVGKKAEESDLAKKGRKVASAIGKGAWEGAGHYIKHDSPAGALGHAAGTVVKNLRKEELELQEKAESQSQQQLFGIALSVKRGETPRSKASKEVLDIVDSMSEGEIRKFAKTKHKGLPQHVKEELLVSKVLRIVRESK